MKRNIFSLGVTALTSLSKEIWDWVKTFIIVICIVVIVRTFFFANYMVHGESMMPTIESGERLIINKIGYHISEPERFDLIVFHATDESDYIKRVIGLPGDSIAYIDDVLYVNDEPLLEDYLQPSIAETTGGPFTRNFTLEDLDLESQIVPDGHLFVLGDNRRNSLDSRQIGYVEYDSIVGKANIRYWPVSDFSIIS